MPYVRFELIIKQADERKTTLQHNDHIFYSVTCQTYHLICIFYTHYIKYKPNITKNKQIKMSYLFSIFNFSEKYKNMCKYLHITYKYMLLNGVNTQNIVHTYNTQVNCHHLTKNLPKAMF
jgi:hypothetical protein